MIHTFTMYANLKLENINYVEEKYNTNYILVTEKIKTADEGINATVGNVFGGWKLFLIVKCYKY